MKKRWHIAIIAAWFGFYPLYFQMSQVSADEMLDSGQEGQDFGTTMMLGGRALPSVQTGNPNAGAASDKSNFYIREFMPGSSIETYSQYSDTYDNPDSMQDLVKQSLKDVGHSGCRTTTFELKENRTILTITALTRTLVPEVDESGIPVLDYAGNPVYTHEDTPGSFDGSEIILNQKTIGVGETEKEIIVAPTVSTPGLVYKYDSAPFAAPADNSYFTYNHQLSPSGTITSFGNAADYWATKATLSPAGITPVVLTADLYRVKRVFSDSGSCAPDPSGCTLDGVSFCAEPGIGIADVFTYAKSYQAEGYELLYDSHYNNVKPPIDDPVLVEIAEKATGYVSPASVGEVLTGCSETIEYNYEEVSVHVEEIRTCHAIKELPDTSGCDGVRNTEFAYFGEQVVYTLEATDEATGLPYDLTGIPRAIGAVTVGEPAVNTWTETISDTLVRYTETISPFPGLPVDRLTTEHAIVGATGSITSYGEPADAWLTVGVVDPSSDRFEVTAKAYDVISNDFTGCEDYVDYVEDGLCTGSFVCTDQRPDCTTIDGVAFCASSGPAQGVAALMPDWQANVTVGADTGAACGYSAIENIDPAIADKMCWAVHGDPMTCDYLDETPECYIDAEGIERCPVFDISGMTNTISPAGYVDDCTALSAIPECTYVGIECSGCAEGLASGDCYSYTHKFDCGEDITSTVPTTMKYAEECGSIIRGLGTEFHNPTEERNGDLSRAVAAAEMVQMMQHDAICEETGEPPTDTTVACTIRIFSGEKQSCSDYIASGAGFSPDCCDQGMEAAAGTDAGAYLQLIYYGYKIAQFKAVQSALTGIPGVSGMVESFGSGWSQIKSGIGSTLRPVTSQLQGLMADIGSELGMAAAENTGAAMDLTGLLDVATSLMYQGISEIATAMGMSEGMVSMLVETTVTESGTTYAAGPLLGVIGIVFMIYSILKIIGHLVFKCEEEELRLGLERKVGNCHFVGDYCASDSIFGCVEDKSVFCCYKSPLARIISEQLRANQNIGGPYGEPEAPNCDGFTMEELAAADWDAIDLTEWIARLGQAGILPNNQAEMESRWGPDSSRTQRLTGEMGEPIKTDEERLNEEIRPHTADMTDNRRALGKEKVCFDPDDPSRMAWYGTVGTKINPPPPPEPVPPTTMTVSMRLENGFRYATSDPYMEYFSNLRHSFRTNSSISQICPSLMVEPCTIISPVSILTPPTLNFNELCSDGRNTTAMPLRYRIYRDDFGLTGWTGWVSGSVGSYGSATGPSCANDLEGYISYWGHLSGAMEVEFTLTTTHPPIVYGGDWGEVTDPEAFAEDADNCYDL